jgi:hypothetical protein
MLPLAGKLSTSDPETYIVVCLHCLHYFRSLPELSRHRLLNHSILDPNESLPRQSNDGSWLVAGGDTEVTPPVAPQPQVVLAAQQPSAVQMSFGPQQIVHPSQFRSQGPHYLLQSQIAYAPGTGHIPIQRTQGRGYPATNTGGSTGVGRTVSSGSTFSPAAKEFIPSSMAGKK